MTRTNREVYLFFAQLDPRARHFCVLARARGRSQQNPNMVYNKPKKPIKPIKPKTKQTKVFQTIVPEKFVFFWFLVFATCFVLCLRRETAKTLCNDARCLTSGRAAGGVVRKDDAACRELQSRRAQKATRDRRGRQEQILGPASARAMVFSTQLAGRFASLVTPVW